MRTCGAVRGPVLICRQLRDGLRPPSAGLHEGRSLEGRDAGRQVQCCAPHRVAGVQVEGKAAVLQSCLHHAAGHVQNSSALLGCARHSCTEVSDQGNEMGSDDESDVVVVQPCSAAHLASGPGWGSSSDDPWCTEKAEMTAMGSAALSADRLWCRLRGDASSPSAGQSSTSESGTSPALYSFPYAPPIESEPC
jgi:hypothetical protein